MIACRLSAFPWEGLNSLRNPNKQTRIKSLQCFWAINSMPSLVRFLTPPQAVWVFANILVGFRKGGIQLFRCSRSSEVCLISQAFLKEVGPEQALWREQGIEHKGDGRKAEILHRSADLERFGKSNCTSFLTGLFVFSH